MNARTLTTLLALVVAVSLAPAVGAQAGFGISSSDTTPVPERTVTVSGDSFTFDSMIRADEGDSVTVDVTAPNDDSYRLHVRNSGNEIVEDLHGSGGDESFTFDLSDYEYGSYAFAVYQDGSYETVQPLLVSGYDVAVDAPESVESDGSAEVTVGLTETAASSDPANVQVIVAQGDSTEEFDASGGDGEYTATIEGGALDEGDYTVYAVAQGDEEAFGRSELLGLSDGHSLAVDSGSNGADGGSGGDSGGDGTGGSESTDETETTEGDDGNESDGSGASDGGDSADESTDDDDGAANPPVNESTETETTTAPPTTTEAVTETTTDDIVTPADDTETETETGATSLVGPGFTVAGALVAVALVALLGRRRL